MGVLPYVGGDQAGFDSLDFLTSLRTENAVCPQRVILLEMGEFKPWSLHCIYPAVYKTMNSGNTVGSVRESLEAVVLVSPSVIGQGANFTDSDSYSVLELQPQIELAETGTWDRFSRQVRRALVALPFAAHARPDLRAASVLSADDAHDAYFRVARTAEVGAAAYARGLLQGLSLWATDAWDGARCKDSHLIGAALVDLWQDAAGREPCVLKMVQTSAAQTDRQQRAASDDDAVYRWIRGHQLFAVLTQGLIATVGQLQPAAAASNAPALERVLCRLALLYQVSAAAFRYASGFRPAQYSHLIRPSMSEPHAPAGFSGSLSADHGELVRRLSADRSVLAHAAVLCPDAYAAMKLALAELYEDHKLVCSRMAGAEGPSLRSQGLAKPSAATEMLDRFKRRRLAMFS